MPVGRPKPKRLIQCSRRCWPSSFALVIAPTSEERWRIRATDTDGRRALGAPLRHRLAEDLLRVRLDRVVEREEARPAAGRRHDVLDVDCAAERVADDGLAARRARELPVELELEAREPLVVDT